MSRRWLIEINASPSLTASSKEDYDLKFGLLDDVVNVIDIENRCVAAVNPAQHSIPRYFVPTTVTVCKTYIVIAG